MDSRKLRKINYGIDAPGLVRTFFLTGFTIFVADVALALVSPNPKPLTLGLEILLAVVSIYCLAMGSFMLFYSGRQKIKDREKLLNLATWTGSETVLDVGCGRGLMLVGAAKRLTTGRSIGIDMWIQRDQTNNSSLGALENAMIEEVRDLIEVKTADMRSLPFTDETFEVVTSTWAVHNLEDATDRQKAIVEMVRVLKKNGLLILADIANQDEYAVVLGSITWKTL